MNYPYLRRGNRLPTVGVLQKLLNRAGATLQVDGTFGPLTEAAVQDFQRPRGIEPAGIVDEATWGRLATGVDLPIADCIDVWNPARFQMEVSDIRHAASNPLLIGGACKGVEQAVEMIRSQWSNVFLLRFHGHGAPGAAGGSRGRGELDADSRQRSDISSDWQLLHLLGRLRPIFGPYGSVQFMHCELGRGSKVHRTLWRLATELRVPVSAEVNDQFGSGIDSSKFEGRTVTIVPADGPLSHWCATRPEFPDSTVP